MTLEEKIMNILSENPEIDENGCIQIHTDYRDREFSTETIKKIINAEHPREMFSEILDDETFYYIVEYGKDELEKYIRQHLTEEENDEFTKHFDDLWEKIGETVQYTYNPKDFNQELNVNMMLDVGNWNYDCVCDNVLNYAATGEEIPQESSILYLAKSQGKGDELKDWCKKAKLAMQNNIERPHAADPLIESCLEEYENLTSSMSTLTMLVKMPLLTVIDLLEVKKEERIGSTKDQLSIIFTQGTNCGLFDPWNGSGSILGITLDNDFKVKLDNLRIAIEGCKTYGYDVDEVYGLIDAVWKPTWNIYTKTIETLSFEW